MPPLFWTILDVNETTFWVTIVLVGSIVWFLRNVVGSTGHAMLFAPVLVIGAFVANYIISREGLFLSADKDAQVAAGLSIGVLLTLLGLLVVMKIVNQSTEKRDARPRRAVAAQSAGDQSDAT